MTKLNDLPFATLQFYTTAPYACSYLPTRVARSQVATPNHAINASTYSGLVNMGFRRSGSFTYRPFCEKCNACVPVRIDTKAFVKSRSQKRAWKKNKELFTQVLEPTYNPEHYSLYSRYQATRHSGGGMDTDNKEQYKHFLLQSNVNSSLIEFRESNGALKIVSIVDHLDDGISSVYTFFDPDEKKSSLGIYNIVWQINYCKSIGMPYVYLGYWIAKSKKMAYKTNFRPIEGLIDGTWRRLDDRGW